jgi:hypothetical protein
MQTCNYCLFKDIVLPLENGHTKYCAQKPTPSRKTKSLVWGPGVDKASPCLKQGIVQCFYLFKGQLALVLLDILPKNVCKDL